jgi:hypothetical protein
MEQAKPIDAHTGAGVCGPGLVGPICDLLGIWRAGPIGR